MAAEVSNSQAWLYESGTFTPIPDPCDRFTKDTDEWDKAIHRAGYETGWALGDLDQGAPCVTVYEQTRDTHPGMPHYMVDVLMGGRAKQIYANEFGSLVELLGKLAPTVTAGLLTAVWDEYKDALDVLVRPAREVFRQEWRDKHPRKR